VPAVDADRASRRTEPMRSPDVTEASRLDVFWHPDVLLHDMGEGVFETPPRDFLDVAEAHVEGPARVRNMHAILSRGPLSSRLDWHDGRIATDGELLRFHPASWLAELRAAAAAGGRRFTRTTLFTPTSERPVWTAAGTALAAADAVMDGRSLRAYALVRPPGHHAGPSSADGYCFLNNIALAAQRCLDRGATRVAILDWDVHHGNGTQEGFYQRDDVLTVSLHMDHGAWGPTHPQTGGADEVGLGPGTGLNLNVPLPMGSGDHAYTTAFAELVVPAVEAFRPEVLLIANGQDANQFDPNGRQLLTMAGFRDLARIARGLADRLCGGRMVLVQEGGYQVSYAAFCLHASLEGILGVDTGLADPLAFLPEDTSRTDDIISRIRQVREHALAAQRARA